MDSPLGKQVTVTLRREDAVAGSPVKLVEGKLLAFSDDGEAVVEQEDGSVAYCWPMLQVDVKEGQS